MYGTNQQVECFDRLTDRHGVETIDDLPKHVVEASGCYSILNTLGALGTVGGLGGCLGVVIYDRRLSRQRTLEIAGTSPPQ